MDKKLLKLLRECPSTMNACTFKVFCISNPVTTSKWFETYQPSEVEEAYKIVRAERETKMKENK